MSIVVVLLVVVCLCIAVLLIKSYWYEDDDYELSGMTDLSGLIYLTVFQPCDHFANGCKRKYYSSNFRGREST